MRDAALFRLSTASDRSTYVEKRISSSVDHDFWGMEALSKMRRRSRYPFLRTHFELRRLTRKRKLNSGQGTQDPCVKLFAQPLSLMSMQSQCPLVLLPLHSRGEMRAYGSPCSGQKRHRQASESDSCATLQSSFASFEALNRRATCAKYFTPSSRSSNVLMCQTFYECSLTVRGRALSNSLV